MKEPIYQVSEQILELVEKNGSITLFELEQALDVSYNLIFLAIDNMVTANRINMKRCGKDYVLSGIHRGTKVPINDACVNEYLCQDV